MTTGPEPLVPGAVTEREIRLIRAAYAAYNSQDLDALIALVGDEVDWPDGARRLHGNSAVRHYWTEQWTRNRTHDEPVAITRRADGRVAVRIDQVVRTRSGKTVSTGRFCHVHRIEGDRIVRLDVETCDAG